MGEQWRIGVPHPTGYPGSASGGDFEDVVQEMHVLLFRFALSAVADPGFPVGGTPTHWGGANFRRIHFSAKTYAKTKEIDPVGGARAPRHPTLDPPMI